MEFPNGVTFRLKVKSVVEGAIAETQVRPCKCEIGSTSLLGRSRDLGSHLMIQCRLPELRLGRVVGPNRETKTRCA